LQLIDAFKQFENPESKSKNTLTHCLLAIPEATGQRGSVVKGYLRLISTDILRISPRVKEIGTNSFEIQNLRQKIQYFT